MQGCIAEDASTMHNNVEKNNKIDQDANIASFSDSPGNNVDHTDFFEPQNVSNSRKENLPKNAEAARHSIFPKGTRIFIVTMAAVCGVVSPLSGNIFYPALNPLSADLHVNQSLINVSLTTYMIFQGISPTLMGNLADTTGRRPAYIIGFTMYIGACIGLALQTSYPALLVLRCLQSSGSSSTIALGTAIAADVATAAERGTYMGLINGGALVGPALGPVLGGILVTFLGWRSIFWFLAIFSGVLLFLLVLAVPETGRNVVGNGSIPPQRWNRDLISVLRARWSLAKSQRPRDENSSPHSIPRESRKRKVRMPNPIATLKILKEKDVQLLLLYNCLVYASYFSVTSSLPYIFAQTYGLNDLQIGLSYLPYGVGALLASLFNGRVLDWRFRQVAKAAGVEIIKGQTTDTRNFPLEKVRFPIALVLILIGNSALLCYGWVVQIQGPLAASLVLLLFIGYCISGSFNCSSIALIDYYPMSPATATAGNNLCRCLLGAGEAAVIIPMIDAMGCGWCFTFISLVIFATTPILWVLTHWGPAWREKRAQRMEAEMISGFS